jgi:hypothetical protein
MRRPPVNEVPTTFVKKEAARKVTEAIEAEGPLGPNCANAVAGHDSISFGLVEKGRKCTEGNKEADSRDNQREFLMSPHHITPMKLRVNRSIIGL